MQVQPDDRFYCHLIVDKEYVSVRGTSQLRFGIGNVSGFVNGKAYDCQVYGKFIRSWWHNADLRRQLSPAEQAEVNAAFLWEQKQRMEQATSEESEDEVF